MLPSSTCNFTKKCTPSQVFFKDFDPTGREQLCCTTRSTSMATSGIYLFIHLFTTLLNVGHTILTRLIKTNVTKN